MRDNISYEIEAQAIIPRHYDGTHASVQQAVENEIEAILGGYGIDFHSSQVEELFGEVDVRGIVERSAESCDSERMSIPRSEVSGAGEFAQIDDLFSGHIPPQIAK